MIYIVEDDAEVREMETYALKSGGFDVMAFECGKVMDEQVKVKVPDLFILDIMLPGEDGLSTLKRLRGQENTKNIPVIMLTAKGTELDKVKGLDLGADDYIAKPFGILEFISRVRAVLRRSERSSSESTEALNLALGGVTLDDQCRSVTVGGIAVELTFKEYELLKLLMSRPGTVFSRQQILEKIWGVDFDNAHRGYAHKNASAEVRGTRLYHTDRAKRGVQSSMKNSLCFSLIYVGVLVALFAVYFTARVFENEMSEQQKRDLRETASLIKNFYGQIPSENFRKNLDSIASKRLRVTLVDRDGMVLYESDAKAGKMENHRSRPEIMDANSKGIGENLRYSVTLNAQVFYFAERLSDGKILRLSRRQAILHESVSKTMPYLLALLTGIVVVAVLIAFGLSRACATCAKIGRKLGTARTYG